MKSLHVLVASLVIGSLSGVVIAQDEEEQEDSRVIEIEVEATPIVTEPGETTYTEEAIENTPTGEGTLADLLRLNPNVDFSRESDLAAGSASLRPDEISIHGQEFYQNLFIIDGADTSNDINPADSADIWSTPSLVAPHGGSSPQGYYINVELLDSVQVYDSNIPVEYGGFTGGVVKSELKSYKGDNMFMFKYGLQRDEWESYHLSEDDISTADRYRGVYTPDYEKANYDLSLQYGIADNLGLTLGITNRQSTFAQEFEDDTDTIRMIDYEDQIQNIIGKLNTTFLDEDLELSFRSTTRSHDGLTSTNYTGRFVQEHSGFGGSAKWTRDGAGKEFKVVLSFDQLSDILDSDSSLFTHNEYLENSGQSRYDGAFGDSEQQQTRWSVKPSWTLDAFEGSGILSSHQFSFGGEFRMTNSFYKRPEDITFENYFCVRDNGREGCQDQDGDGVSSAGDQYLFALSYYYAGEVDVSYEELSGYIQDVITIGDDEATATTLTLGLRTDWESYLENFNLSPRASASRPLAGGDITVGLSRYYGRSFLRYELNDAIYGWREIFLHLARPRGRAGEEIPCSNTAFMDCTHRTFADRSGVSELDTPFSNEFMIGWSSSGWNIDTSVQYVNRQSRDGVSRQRDEDGNYFYTNEGESSTHSISTAFTNSTLVEVGPSRTKISFSLGYRDRTSNSQDDDGYDDIIDPELIYYDGELVTLDELPAWDYNVPFTLNFFAVTEIPVWGISITNYLNHRSGGTIARDSREDYTDPDTGLDHDIYADFDFDDLVTVDTKIDWRGRISDRLQLFAKFEIHNLFDQIVDQSQFDTRKRYTQGRRFWIEVGISFR